MTAGTGFDEFVITRSQRLMRLALLLTRDHAAAEDLVQTALVKAWSAWRRIDEDPEPYVRRVLVNTFNSWWRRRWTAEHPTAVLPERAWSGAQGEVEDRDEVWRALTRLPRQQRAVLVLRYFEDLSEAQIAETLGVSAGAVKNYAAKGLAKLRLDPTLRELPEPHLTEQPAGTQRLVAVRGRIDRRRRLAVVGVVAAVVLAVVLGVLVAPRVNTSMPPAERRIGGFAEYHEGYHVVAVGKGTVTGPVTLTWVPASLDVGFFFHCTRPEKEDLHVTFSTVLFDGKPAPHGVTCNVNEPDNGYTWYTQAELAPLELRLGVPVTVTLTDPVPYDAHGGTHPVPATVPTDVNVAVALAEPVPFEQYPLPARPAHLTPLDKRLPSELNYTVLSADNPSATVSWGHLTVVYHTQTPGQLLLSVNGTLTQTQTWWDYKASGHVRDLRSGPGYDYEGPAVPDIPPGTPVTITIEARYLTGDWYVEMYPNK
ncbi:SigE family RNA polymerase sigma factor [Longispora fulva]|uniref:RNA polymerase sigma-70 factor (Sigma-E family) n=1 Tax=Longispora fulva TaxID=619741 RepID=A0A8J7KWB0_9ACTN|nr:SigE family RNA polymerase sigma factor [Longispora fulva]MBG6136337.1 RNA polymerase sigma-70 factor (sigma-E family) [Longispora fulva]